MSSNRPFSIPILDGIRALSFLIVFISHDRLEQIPGLFGVAVFFFLSGYLITTLMRMEIESYRLALAEELLPKTLIPHLAAVLRCPGSGRPLGCAGLVARLLHGC